MHVRSAGVIALAVLACLPACRKPSATAPAASPFCHGRPRCQEVDRRAAGSPQAGQVVVVRLAAPPDAGNDEERCDRREYWLARPGGELLLAADCEAQWGAENAGPATLSLAGDVATFRYVELLANDQCELVEAKLRLPQGRIETHARRWGTVVDNRCRPSRRLAPVPSPGTGALDHPVVVLHRS